MNETISVILNRRSVRRYLPDPINEEALNLILQCGLYAPNGGNHQVPRFLVVQNKGMIQKVNALLQETLASRELIPGVYQNKSIIVAKQNKEHSFLFHAPVLIIAVAPKNHGNSMADCSCALENMQLAATALGLGACWINQIHWTCDDEPVRKWLLENGMTEDEAVFGSIVAGYPAAQLGSASPRKEGRIIMVGNGDLL